MANAQDPLSITLRGRLVSPPPGRVGRALVYATGLFLLRPLLLLLLHLLGWRREARLTWSSGELHLVTQSFFLGHLLHTENETLAVSRVCSVATVTSRAEEPVALGALAVTVSLAWGLLQVADGLLGRSLGLVAMGLGAMALGVVVDLFILWVARVLPDPLRHGMVLRRMGAEPLLLRGVDPDRAQQLAHSLSAGLSSV